MSVLAPLGGPAEFELELRDTDFHWLRETASQHSGIVLPEAKRNMIYSRLKRRLRALGLNSFSEYRKLLSQKDSPEFGEFINALTTNLTAFFREKHHFEHLARVAAPDLQARFRKEPLRVWSAGCSTGEEPYSIAMTLLEACPPASGGLSIVATDLDTKVLAHAAAGVYDNERLEPISLEYRRRYLERGAGAFAGSFRVREKVQARMKFSQLNLTANWRHDAPLHVIFCRNVIIYFDQPRKRLLFDQMADQLVPGGYLYIGHAETLFQISDRFEACGQTIYRRIA